MNAAKPTEEPDVVTPDPFEGENTSAPVIQAEPEEGQDGHPDLPASYHSENGEYLVNVARPWGPLVVSVIPRGWHGNPPLQLPLEDLPQLIAALNEAQKKHKGQA